jgi:hypothetical protein
VVSGSPYLNPVSAKFSLWRRQKLVFLIRHVDIVSRNFVFTSASLSSKLPQLGVFSVIENTSMNET